MAERRLKRPRDPMELAKLIGDIATGKVADKTDDGKSAAAFGNALVDQPFSNPFH